LIQYLHPTFSSNLLTVCNENNRKALNIKKEKLPPTHEDNAPTLYELAKCYFAEDMVDKASLCYKEAHRIWKLNHKFIDAANASFDLVRDISE